MRLTLIGILLTLLLASGCAREGFTIRGGSAGIGGAVYCYSASKPTFTECVFEENCATARGGAFSCGSDSDAAIRGCIFRGNTAGSEGGALHCNDSDPVVVDCRFIGNRICSPSFKPRSDVRTGK